MQFAVISTGLLAIGGVVQWKTERKHIGKALMILGLLGQLYVPAQKVFKWAFPQKPEPIPPINQTLLIEKRDITKLHIPPFVSTLKLSKLPALEEAVIPTHVRSLEVADCDSLTRFQLPETMDYVHLHRLPIDNLDFLRQVKFLGIDSCERLEQKAAETIQELTQKGGKVAVENSPALLKSLSQFKNIRITFLFGGR